MRILIIEDEADILRFMKLELEHEGYETDQASTGPQGLEKALKEDYALILLDVMLPGLSGFEVLRRLRKQKQTPVILLTARGEVTDKVTGLDLGANDYVTKPFHMEELLARIRAVLRTERSEILSTREIRLDTGARLAYVGERPLHLTKTQYALLECLLRHKNRVCTREQLLEEVWGYSYGGEGNVVDVYIRYLRRELGPEAGSIIETVRGVGYVIREK